MILPVSTETAGKIRGCLLKLSDCWKPPSCSLRALSTDPGCCCHCQPGEAAAQLDPSLAVFWLKIREMRMPTCKDTKPSRQSVRLIGNFYAPLTRGQLSGWLGSLPGGGALCLYSYATQVLLGLRFVGLPTFPLMAIIGHGRSKRHPVNPLDSRCSLPAHSPFSFW